MNTVPIATSITNNINKLDNLIGYYDNYNCNNLFLFNNNTIYDSIFSIDVTAFNVEFLKYINSIINDNVITIYIKYLESIPKMSRVESFGMLYKNVNNTIKLNHYLIGFRNIIFKPLIDLIVSNSKTINLFRLNYDDMEFSYIDDNIYKEFFVDTMYSNVVKFKKYDKIIVLNKQDGVYYINDGKIVNIKYTSGWVNIPAYNYIITLCCNFLISNDINMKELNESIYKYITLADDSDFIGHDDDISKSLSSEILTLRVKYLFVAKVMSKFSILFN